MRRRTFLANAAAGLLLPAVPALGGSTTTPGETNMASPQSGRVAVNGIDLHYDLHGSGEPLVLLHGGMTVYETLGELLPELARGHQVIVPHMQGHGFTRDVDRPLDYPTMAADVVALLDHLEVRRAHFVGYSMGAGVALQTAIRSPERVDRLVVISTTVARDGWYPEVVQAFHDMRSNAAQFAAGIAQAPFAKNYPDVDWEALFRKMGELEKVDFDWSDEVATITAPTLLVFADADAVMPEHIVHMYKLFGGGQRDGGLDGSGRSPNQLAIVPNTTHYTLNSAAVAATVAGFVDGSAATGNALSSSADLLPKLDQEKAE